MLFTKKLIRVYKIKQLMVDHEHQREARGLPQNQVPRRGQLWKGLSGPPRRHKHGLLHENDRKGIAE